MHEEYIDDRTNYIIRNDIALLRLKEPIIWNRDTSPICISNTEPEIGQLCYATGWGLTTGAYVNAYVKYVNGFITQV